jgi:hypothetical protein
MNHVEESQMRGNTIAIIIDEIEFQHARLGSSGGVRTDSRTGLCPISSLGARGRTDPVAATKLRLHK